MLVLTLSGTGLGFHIYPPLQMCQLQPGGEQPLSGELKVRGRGSRHQGQTTILSIKPVRRASQMLLAGAVMLQSFQNNAWLHPLKTNTNPPTQPLCSWALTPPKHKQDSRVLFVALFRRAKKLETSPLPTGYRNAACQPNKPHSNGLNSLERHTGYGCVAPAQRS